MPRMKSPSKPKAKPKGKRSRGRPSISVTRKMMQAICEEFSKHGLFGAACKSVGISKQTGQRRRDTDPEFDEMVRSAWQDFRERTIASVQRHAWEGINEPIFHQGQVVGIKTTYNTRMMELEAKRVVPEYRDNHKQEGNIPRRVVFAYLPENARDGAEPEGRDDGSTD